MSQEGAQRGGRGAGVMGAAAIVVVMAAAMWVSEAADFLLPGTTDFAGILPRTAAGLDGVLWAPFLHGGFGHLMSNTVPFLVLGLLVAWRAGAALWRIMLVIVLIGGLGVWLLAPTGVVTIGASGLVFGLLGYLLAAGALTRRPVDILIAAGVLLAYGSLLLGATPFGVPAGVSWLAHLTGFAAGILAAAWLAPRRRPQSAPAALP